nr:flagellar export chaperone FlgN [Schwartzia sp. (in: firmicutes)]
MWQNLIQALKDLSDAYAALLSISGKKRAALVAVDLKGLEPIVEEEKQQLERIRVAEKRRQDALLALSGKIPSIHAATTMAEVEAECPQEFRALLKEIHGRLSKRVNDAQEASEAN